MNRPTSRLTLPLLVLFALFAGGCAEPASQPSPSATAGGDAEPEAEVVSLLGRPLFRPVLGDDRLAALEEALDAAGAAYDAAPDDEDAIIWLGRRTAYLSRYREAVEIFSAGLATHPDSYRLLRHRGHRYITLRRFDAAIADLSRAAALAAGSEDQIEADGIPNALGRPLSTTLFNIWYHLALAHYLAGDYEAALAAYDSCMAVSTNPDLLVATTDWQYMTLRRLGRHDEARALLEPISAGMEIIENDAYHRRLLMYKGEVAPEDLIDLTATDDPDVALNIATQGYGVANWYLAEGDPERARALLQRILEGSSWAAFGYIAAEVDLATMAPLE